MNFNLVEARQTECAFTIVHVIILFEVIVEVLYACCRLSVNAASTPAPSV